MSPARPRTIVRDAGVPAAGRARFNREPDRVSLKTVDALGVVRQPVPDARSLLCALDRQRIGPQDLHAMKIQVGAQSCGEVQLRKGGRAPNSSLRMGPWYGRRPEGYGRVCGVWNSGLGATPMRSGHRAGPTAFG